MMGLKDFIDRLMHPWLPMPLRSHPIEQGEAVAFKNLINRLTKIELDELHNRVRSIPKAYATACEIFLLLELSAELDRRKDEADDPQISEMPWSAND